MVKTINHSELFLPRGEDKKGEKATEVPNKIVQNQRIAVVVAIYH